MRDPNRIEPFLNEIGKIWKENCPDWRFGQFIENVFSSIPGGTWNLSEDDILDQFRIFFNPDSKERKEYHTLEKVREETKKYFRKE